MIPVNEQTINFCINGKTNEADPASVIIYIRGSLGYKPVPIVDLVTASDWGDVNCAKDVPVGSLLAGPPDTSQKMTIEICQSNCKDFTLAGLENGQDCYCGTEFKETIQPAPLSECSTPCPGNANEKCGGPQRLQWYKKNDSAV